MQNNWVKVLQDKRYDYDGFGRLIRKRIGSHTEQHYRYDHQHRLTQVAVVRAGKDGQPQSQVFSYQYDALGRRIVKTDSFGTTAFTWEGMRLLQESRGAQTSTYIYEPGSYVPLARIDGAGAIEPHPAAAHALGGDAAQGKQASVPITNPQWADRFNVVAAANDEPDGSGTPNVREGTGSEDIAQVYYFHTQPNGLPEELSDNSGNLVWRAQYTTWGSTVSEQWQSFDTAGRPQHQLASQTASLQQNLRMQGQYLDRETGLHYSTFRYYDADFGAFTTPDPIGLLGGLNLHQYAPNSTGWNDPWGWKKNSNSQMGNWKIYDVYTDASRTERVKVGIADADRRHQGSGTAKRTQDSLRKAQKTHPNAVVVERPGIYRTTKVKMRPIEAKEVRILRNKGHVLPGNKEKERKSSQ